jgi:hypothetical protein
MKRDPQRRAPVYARWESPLLAAAPPRIAVPPPCQQRPKHAPSRQRLGCIAWISLSHLHCYRLRLVRFWRCTPLNRFKATRQHIRFPELPSVLQKCLKHPAKCHPPYRPLVNHPARLRLRLLVTAVPPPRPVPPQVFEYCLHPYLWCRYSDPHAPQACLPLPISRQRKEAPQLRIFLQTSTLKRQGQPSSFQPHTSNICHCAYSSLSLLFMPLRCPSTASSYKVAKASLSEIMAKGSLEPKHISTPFAPLQLSLGSQTC